MHKGRKWRRGVGFKHILGLDKNTFPWQLETIRSLNIFHAGQNPQLSFSLLVGPLQTVRTSTCEFQISWKKQPPVTSLENRHRLTHQSKDSAAIPAAWQPNDPRSLYLVRVVTSVSLKMLIYSTRVRHKYVCLSDSDTIWQACFLVGR